MKVSVSSLFASVHSSPCTTEPSSFGAPATVANSVVVTSIWTPTSPSKPSSGSTCSVEISVVRSACEPSKVQTWPTLFVRRLPNSVRSEPVRTAPASPLSVTTTMVTLSEPSVSKPPRFEKSPPSPSGFPALPPCGASVRFSATTEPASEVSGVPLTSAPPSTTASTGIGVGLLFDVEDARPSSAVALIVREPSTSLSSFGVTSIVPVTVASTAAPVIVIVRMPVPAS